MKRLAAILLTFACSGSPPAPQAEWRIDKRVTIDDGAWLEPDDPQRPGEAGPSAMVQRGDSLWITYAHLRGYKPAGTGWLAEHDATSLERTRLIELEHEGDACLNPVALHLDDERAYVACSGHISFDDPSDDGRVMTVSLETGLVVGSGRVGDSPGSIIRAGDHLWLGDGERGGAWRLEAATLSNPMHHQPCRVDATHQGYVSELLAHEGRLFAACFNDDTLLELDPASGEVLYTLPTGDAPLRLREAGGRLFVLDNLGGTVTVVALTTPPVSQPAALALGARGEQGGNDPQGLDGSPHFVGVTNSAWGSFVVVDLETSQITTALDLKPTPGAATNFPTEVTFADDVFHVLVPGLELDTNDVPGELIRIVRVDP